MSQLIAASEAFLEKFKGALIVTAILVGLVVIGFSIDQVDEAPPAPLESDSQTSVLLDQQTPTPEPSPSSFRVVKVRDGDTIEVDISGKTEAVRLVGINTPESVDPRRPVECFGKEASNRLKSLLENQVVTLETDPTQSDRDRYDRLLRFVFLDGKDVGLQMLAEGYAQEALYSDTPHRYHEEYLVAQKYAQEQELGLWSTTACPLPSSPEPSPQPSPSPKVQGVTSQTQTTTAPKPAAAAPTASWPCDCSKTCSQIASCAEAQYLLNTCGCSQRDGDGDGVACDSRCQ